MQQKKYQYLFGPVPSRRLGSSLGVNLTPHKTCSLDCIYCECGPTTNLTVNRKEYIDTNEVINELNDLLPQMISLGTKLDYITFSGLGEPSLHNGIGKIVNFLKDTYPQFNVALITNSVLLSDDMLIREIKDVDLIVPSLDGVLNESFQKINRPHPSIILDKVIQGLINFSKSFNGKIWLEIFIVPGVNTSKEELLTFKDIIKKINPTKVQLNSLDRPGALKDTPIASLELLIEIRDFLNFPQTDILTRKSETKEDELNKHKKILASLKN